jgi:DNA-binding winged helix-turn-helix (wHTH) protein/tetratricopeptide (TPR) repeat protein
MLEPHYQIGPFTLDTRRKVLTHDGKVVRLGPTAIEILLALLDARGSVVTKNELMDRVWPDGFVEEGNLTQHVHRLRAAFKEAGTDRAIETIPRCGYRLHVSATPSTEAALRVLVVPPRRRLRTALAVTMFALLCCLGAVLAIANALKPSSTLDRLTSQSRRDYAIGQYHLSLRPDVGQLRLAAQSFERVVRRDPGSPLGYAGLADTYIGLYDEVCGSTTPCEYAKLAESAAKTAHRLDPHSAEGETSLAMVTHVFFGDDARAAAAFERVVANDPHYALAHEWYGNLLLMRGHLERSRQEFEAAAALQPVDATTYAWMAHVAYSQRRYREAASLSAQALSLNPRRFEARVLMGIALEASGDRAQALAVFDALGETPLARVLLAAMYARDGERARARALLDPSEQRGAIRSGFGSDLALAWIALGDSDRALAVMRRAPKMDWIKRRFLALDPRMDPVRADPRFRSWLVLN